MISKESSICCVDCKIRQQCELPWRCSSSKTRPVFYNCGRDHNLRYTCFHCPKYQPKDNIDNIKEWFHEK